MNPASADGVLTLRPPEAFAMILDGPYPIYRCTSVHTQNQRFLTTLELKSILYLSVEKPPKPLTTFASDHNMELIHLGLWQPRTWETFTPLSQHAVEKTLSHLVPEKRPALLVDGGHGVFLGVLRKLMRWNHTSIVLEYRAFAGMNTRYRNEEFVEMVEVGEIAVPEGVEFLPRRRGGAGGRGRGGAVEGVEGVRAEGR